MPIIQDVYIPGEFRLSATLTIPDSSRNKFPAVVMVSAVGDIRDGGLGGIKTKIFSKLADIFNNFGFATLRYDKRGCGKSEGDYYSSGLLHSISDAVRAVRFLKTREEIDPNRILLLGHSEGAIVAPAIYEQEKTAGVILLCGAAAPGSELATLPFKKAIDELAALHSLPGFKGYLSKLFVLDKIVQYFFSRYLTKVMSTDRAVIRFFGIKCNAAWYRELYNFNVIEHLQRLNCPTLVIGGSKDIQSTPDYVQKIVDLVPGEGTSHIIPGMNHLLREYHGQHTMFGAFSQYKKSVSDPLSTVLVEKLEQWVLDNNFSKPT